MLAYVTNLVTRGHHRSVKAKKNIIATFIIRGGNLLINLILVPLTIQYVNPSKYGIWITLSSVIGWFGLFDLGFGYGLRNKLAESIARGEVEKARIYVSTTYAILSIISVILLTIFITINHFLDWSKILNSPASMSAELGYLALIVFVLYCFQFVLQLITTVLTADQQPAKAYLFGLVGNILLVFIIIILKKTSSDNLTLLGIAYGSAPLLALGFSNLWFYSKNYKLYAPSFKYVDFSYASKLMSIGFKFFIIQISGIVLYQTSNVIIIQLFGADEVTSYNIAFRYFGLISLVAAIVMTPFWSACTDAWIKNDIDWIRTTIYKLKVMCCLLSILAFGMLIFSGFIYRIWVGKEINVPFNFSAMMLLYAITNTWNSIYSLFLNGVGKIRLQFYVGIFDMIIFIPLAIYLGHKWGVAGIILSSVILCGKNLIWVTIQYNKIINGSANGIWAQ